LVQRDLDIGLDVVHLWHDQLVSSSSSSKEEDDGLVVEEEGDCLALPFVDDLVEDDPLSLPFIALDGFLADIFLSPPSSFTPPPSLLSPLANLSFFFLLSLSKKAKSSISSFVKPNFDGWAIYRFGWDRFVRSFLVVVELVVVDDGLLDDVFLDGKMLLEVLVLGDDSLDDVLLLVLGELEVDVALVIILAVSKISEDSPLSVVTSCCCCTASSLLLLPLLVDDIVSSLLAVVVVVLLRVVRPTVGREGDVPILIFLVDIYVDTKYQI